MLTVRFKEFNSGVDVPTLAIVVIFRYSLEGVHNVICGNEEF